MGPWLHWAALLGDSNRYAAARPTLWTIAALVPIAGIAGFVVSGQLTAEVMRDPDALAQLKERSNWPNAADGAIMAQMRDWTQYLFGAALAVYSGTISSEFTGRARERI